MISIYGKTLLVASMLCGLMHGMNTPIINFDEMPLKEFLKIDASTLTENQLINYRLRLAVLNAEKNNARPTLGVSGSNITVPSTSELDLSNVSPAAAIAAPSPRRISSLPDLEGGVDPSKALELKISASQQPASLPSSATASPSVPNVPQNSGASSSSSTTSSISSSASSSTADLASLDKTPKKLVTVLGVAGVALAVWTATEVLVASKNISQEEWDNAKQFHNKLGLLAKRAGKAMLSRPAQAVSIARNVLKKMMHERNK